MCCFVIIEFTNYLFYNFQFDTFYRIFCYGTLFNLLPGLSDMLVKDAISHIFLNPVIWVYSVYRVQRELFMFLIQQFDNDPRLLRSLCRLPRVLDIIRQFYWDDVKTRFAIGSKPLLHPVTKQVIGERPSKDEIHKIRLLLLSLGEMSLR